MAVSVMNSTLNEPQDRKSSITRTFESYRSTLDESNERRERLIILSRQTTSLSKKLIFHLHRSSLHPEHDQGEKNQAERKRILQEAEGKVKEIGDVLKTVGQELEQAGLDYWAFARNISPGVQEYIESVSFLHYLRYRSLITVDEIRASLSTEGKPPFEISMEDYVLGISDLSGELMRYATNCSSTGDYPSALSACTTVRDLKAGLDGSLPYVRELGKKQSITEQSLGKIEKVCYAIRLRLMEYGDRPDVLERLAKRGYDEDGPEGSAGNDAVEAGDNQGQGGAERGRERKRGRGNGRAAAGRGH